MDDDASEVRVRWPRPEDATSPFEAAGVLRGRTEWPQVLAWHLPEAGGFVWVAECGGEVAGFAAARVFADHLYIELLARNALCQAAQGQRVGHKLVRAATALAWSFALPWITLESADDPATLRFYEREGFLRDGPPLFDAAWGTLHPMRLWALVRPPEYGETGRP